MKTIMLALFLCCLTAIAQPRFGVNRGFYFYQHRESGTGRIKLEVQQRFAPDKSGVPVLEDRTLMAPSSGVYTQTMTITIYRGQGGHRASETWIEWLETGEIITNHYPVVMGGQASLFAAGNQGTKAWLHPNNGDRHILACYSSFIAEWPLPVAAPCDNDDDIGTVVGLWRTNSSHFIGCSTILRPAEKKGVSIPIPVDTVWEYMGWDKCIGCTTACWLPAWPKNAIKKLASIQKNGNVIGVSFSALPGMSLDLQQSTDLNTWESVGKFTVPANGELTYQDTMGTLRFYRVKEL